MFYISAGVYAFAAIFYCFLGSGELQPWAIPPQTIKDLEIQVDDSTVDGPPQTIEVLEVQVDDSTVDGPPQTIKDLEVQVDDSTVDGEE